MADVPSFGLHTPVDLFNKLVEERKDLDRSDCLDERHALNAVWTAYHLYDWAFRDAEAKGLLTQWGIAGGTEDKQEAAFRRYLIGRCSLLEVAGLITHGTKHFDKKPSIDTGQHEGAFDRNAFQADAFDVDYLMSGTLGSNIELSSCLIGSSTSGAHFLSLISGQGYNRRLSSFHVAPQRPIRPGRCRTTARGETGAGGRHTARAKGISLTETYPASLRRY